MWPLWVSANMRAKWGVRRWRVFSMSRGCRLAISSSGSQRHSQNFCFKAVVCHWINNAFVEWTCEASIFKCHHEKNLSEAVFSFNSANSLTGSPMFETALRDEVYSAFKTKKIIFQITFTVTASLQNALWFPGFVMRGPRWAICHAAAALSPHLVISVYILIWVWCPFVRFNSRSRRVKTVEFREYKLFLDGRRSWILMFFWSGFLLQPVVRRD